MEEFPDSVITLDDTDPEVFNTYLECVVLGHGTLKEHIAAMVAENPCTPETRSDNDSSDGGVEGDGNSAVSDAAGVDRIPSNPKHKLPEKFLVDTYLLAIKLIDLVAANLAIDELVNLYATECRISKEMVVFVYYSTPKDSKLRLLYRDLHVHRMQDSWLGDVLEGTQYPYEFVGEVMRRAWRLKRSQTGMEIGVTYFKGLRATRYHQDIDESSAVSTASTSAPKQEE
jgi:hypothetical protein